MRLKVHESGIGEKVAILIHGAMADHGTWHALEAVLHDRGYRVLAPDLRGHGESPWGAYSPELLAEDLVENLPSGADVAIGHSMGGLALSLAVGALRPRRAVYSDPGFVLRGSGELVGQMKRMAACASADSIRERNPNWSDADITAEMDGFRRFDPRFLDQLEELAKHDFIPDRPEVPSLVQLADGSNVVDEAGADRLRRNGFEVTVVTGAGHCIHRDDFPAFQASLKGWI